MYRVNLVKREVTVRYGEKMVAQSGCLSDLPEKF
jgi:hypothetical protein